MVCEETAAEPAVSRSARSTREAEIDSRDTKQTNALRSGHDIVGQATPSRVWPT